jgi:hypothetical protein
VNVAGSRPAQRRWPTTLKGRSLEYFAFAAQFIVGGLIAELVYLISMNSVAAVGVGLAVVVLEDIVGALQFDLTERRRFAKQLADMQRHLWEFAAVFAAIGAVLLLVAPLAPHAVLAAAFPYAFFSNLFRIRRAGRRSMRKSFRGLVASLAILAVAAAGAFRAVAHLPGSEELTTATSVAGALWASVMNAATLGLHAELPGSGWGRVVGLAQLWLLTWWLYAWGLLPSPWRPRRAVVPDPNRVFPVPATPLDELVILLWLSVFVFKTAPGMSSPWWFYITAFLVVTVFPMFIVLSEHDIPPKWRLGAFARAVLIQLALFVMLYFAGSNALILEFSVNRGGVDAPYPLSAPESLYLAVGTLTTAGAAGIAPINDFARIAMVMQFVLPGLFALWLFGAAQWLTRSTGEAKTSDVGPRGRN